MHYDSANEIMFILNRANPTINFFYLQNSTTNPKMMALESFKSKDSNLDLYYMPTRHVDYMNNEIVRALRMGTTTKTAEFISFRVPRKSTEFQEDIFPPCLSGEESQTHEAWAGGETKAPITRSFVEDNFFSQEKTRSQDTIVRQDVFQKKLTQNPESSPVKVEPPKPKAVSKPVEQKPAYNFGAPQLKQNTTT